MPLAINHWLEQHTAQSAADIQHRAIHGTRHQMKIVSWEKRHDWKDEKKEPRDIILLDEQHNRLAILRKYLKDSKTERQILRTSQ